MPRRPVLIKRSPTGLGDRLPTLQTVGNDRTIVWQKLVVGDWYGGHSQAVEYCTSTALWYHGGKKPLVIRWVLVRLDGHVRTARAVSIGYRRQLKKNARKPNHVERLLGSTQPFFTIMDDAFIYIMASLVLINYNL